MRSIKLYNNMKIPKIIFGPDELGYKPRKKKFNNIVLRILKRLKRKIYDERIYINQVANAIKIGFHSIDFSAAYGDGKLISKAIKKSGVDRKDIFLITRVSNKAQFLGKEAIEKELLKQLKGFDTDYVDMLMFHWPVKNCFENTWKEMITLRNRGLCKALGVANCHQHHIEKLYNCSGEYPLINQIEVHPLFTQLPLRKYCIEHKIQIMSYSPTARQDDRLFNPSLLKNLSQKYNKTQTQIILRWHIQSGLIPTIRSLNYKHQKEDINIFDFNISDEDMKLIDNMNINARVRYDPDNCDFSIL